MKEQPNFEDHLLKESLGSIQKSLIEINSEILKHKNDENKTGTSLGPFFDKIAKLSDIGNKNCGILKNEVQQLLQEVEDLKQ